MSTIKELREKQANILAQARSLNDEITEKTGESRAAELEAQHDKAMADYDKIGERITRQERLEAEEQRMRNAPDHRRPAGDGEAVKQEERKVPTHAEVFKRALRVGDGQLSGEERMILAGLSANVPAELRAQSTSTSAGGYLVPTELQPEIDKAMAIWGPMLDDGLCRVVRTASGAPINWPTLDDTAKVGALTAENAAVTNDGGNDLVFGQKTLNSYLYNSEIVLASIQFLQQSDFDVDGVINEAFGERLARTVNTALTTGTGSSQPNGIVTASALGKTAASATAVTADEIIDLYHSVNAAYRSSPNAAFQLNDSTLAAIRKLKDGQGNYLWSMGDVRGDVPGSILGKPYFINAAMADIGTGAKPIIFGDHSKYVVRRVGDTALIRFGERFLDSLQIGFMAYMQVDGELLNSAAVKHLANA